jgi:hypothetical protein
MTYKKTIDGTRNLELWSRNQDNVTGLLSTWKGDFAIPLFLEPFDLMHSRTNDFTMKQSIDGDLVKLLA